MAYKGKQRVRRSYRGLRGVKGVKRVLKIFQGVTGGYRGLQEFKMAYKKL